jgi:hypothetical protein
LKTQGDKLTTAIKTYGEEAHKCHHRADFFDYGELGVELSLILCSIALLAKDRRFWYTGVAAAILGCGVALAGFVIPPAHEEYAGEEFEKVAELTPPEALWTGSSSGTAAPRLDEGVDAQGDKNAAQQRHRCQADTADPFDPALADQR